jgi:hypothetical protein
MVFDRDHFGLDPMTLKVSTDAVLRLLCARIIAVGQYRYLLGCLQERQRILTRFAAHTAKN